eukprot:1160170-Pelagomonas_calceolata.AAC.3
MPHLSLTSTCMLSTSRKGQKVPCTAASRHTGCSPLKFIHHINLTSKRVPSTRKMSRGRKRPRTAASRHAGCSPLTFIHITSTSPPRVCPQHARCPGAGSGPAPPPAGTGCSPCPLAPLGCPLGHASRALHPSWQVQRPPQPGANEPSQRILVLIWATSLGRHNENRTARLDAAWCCCGGFCSSLAAVARLQAKGAKKYKSARTFNTRVSTGADSGLAAEEACLQAKGACQGIHVCCSDMHVCWDCTDAEAPMDCTNAEASLYASKGAHIMQWHAHLLLGLHTC